MINPKPGIPHTYRTPETAELCEHDPRAATLCQSLLSAEAEGEKAGWNSKLALPHLFRLESNPDTGDVMLRLFQTFNTQIYTRIVAMQASPYQALLPYALAFEHSRREGIVLNARIGVGMEAPPEGHDLFGGSEEGFVFTGIGMRAESWKVTATADDKDTQAAARAGKLDEHPERQDVRNVRFVHRDGTVWTIERVRGEAVPEVLVVRQGDEMWPQGQIMNVLSRMCNAVAGNDVPIIAPAEGRPW